MKKIALSLALVTLTSSWAQNSQKAEFEVASIRLSKPDNGHDSSADHGSFRTHNLSVKRLISMAYDVDFRQVFGGPAWTDSDGFDINAKIPDEFTESRTIDDLHAMIRKLLSDRFQLVFHREEREMPGLILVVAKKGPKMEHAKASDKDSNLHSSNGHIQAQNVTMGSLARHLSRDVGMVVVDKTGLEGGFNFEYEWTRQRLGVEPEPARDGPPSIFTALQERLGLKLESAKLPVQVIVIDSAQKPEEN